MKLETKIAVREKKACEYCNKMFIPSRFHSNQKFCSLKCKNTIHRYKLKKKNPNYQKEYFEKYW